ncbi:hypothetical protein BM477_01105 [Boudabousia marimammalium]|uniref:Uncharacterized protein n=1 Tax=Boudabousia marimammalium TaxID=156892 RepID=A0A1Q5PSU8_9ACTO|nr:hypothetical protein BM477_01105 [Boudabousia marimammalium]
MSAFFDNSFVIFAVFGFGAILFLGLSYMELHIFSEPKKKKRQGRSFSFRWKHASRETKVNFFLGHLALIPATLSLLDILGLITIVGP